MSLVWEVRTGRTRSSCRPRSSRTSTGDPVAKRKLVEVFTVGGNSTLRRPLRGIRKHPYLGDHGSEDMPVDRLPERGKTAGRKQSEAAPPSPSGSEGTS